MARDGNPLSVEARKNRSYLFYGFSIVIMVIIGVSLIGTLAPSGFGDAGSTLVFGTYDGQEITFTPNNFFGASYEWHYRDQSSRFPEGVDQRILAYGVWRQAFNDTVLHTARVHAALAGGVHVSQQRVDQALITSIASYEDLEEMPVATREGNLERLRELLVRQRYADDLTRGRLSSGNEVTFYEEMIRDERRFEFISLADDAYPDSEVAAYGEANAADFRRVDLSRIQIRGGADAAEEIRQRIVSGTATFEDQARAHSQDEFADQGGELGFRYFYQVSQDFTDPETAERVFALAEGEVSEVLASGVEETRYLYRADSRVVQPDFSDTDTIAKIRAYLTTAERGLVENYLLAQADRFGVAAAQSDFHTAASELDLTVHTTEWFPINYRNGAAPRPVATTGELPLLAGAANFDEFFQQGFALQRRGDVSKAIRLPDRVIVLSFLDEREIPSENLRSAAGESVLDLFIAQARNADLEWWVNTNGLLEDTFSQAFAAITGSSGG